MIYISPKHSLLMSFFLMATFNVHAQPLPVVVKTYGEHYGGKIVYHHQVTNNGVRNVVGVALGLDTDDQGNEGQPITREQGELNFVMPEGADLCNPEINSAAISGPTGWTAQIIQIEHTGCYLQWRRPPRPGLSLLPGQTLNFSVTVPEYAKEYITGHFSAGYADGKDPWYYNGAMELLDKVPPVLTVALTPSVIRENDKIIPITATIAVTDDYDPSPEIKLESITATETLGAGDIQNAQLGTDDKQFNLVAKRAGTNQAGRIYTVTYSATDASGNKATASATVTVPREQNQKDHAEKDRGDKKENERKDGKSDKDAEHHASEKKPFWKFW